MKMPKTREMIAEFRQVLDRLEKKVDREEKENNFDKKQGHDRANSAYSELMTEIPSRNALWYKICEDLGIH